MTPLTLLQSTAGTICILSLLEIALRLYFRVYLPLRAGLPLRELVRVFGIVRSPQEVLVSSASYKIAKSCPPRHREQYFNRDFFDEIIEAVTPYLKDTSDHTKLACLPTSSTSRGSIRHVSGFRATIDFSRRGEGSARPSLYCLGGSTMHCLEVPDDKTISSQLSVLVGEEFVVVNAGVAGSVAWTRLKAFADHAKNTADGVIILLGCNEISDFWRVRRLRIGAKSKIGHSLLNRLLYFESVSEVVKRLLLPLWPISPVLLARKLEGLQHRMNEVLDQLRSFARQGTGPLVVCLQPILPLSKDANPWYHYLESLLPGSGLVPLRSKTTETCRQAYSTIRSQFQAANDIPRLRFVDLTTAYDHIDGMGFLDIVHASSHGNRQIALGIASQLDNGGKENP